MLERRSGCSCWEHVDGYHYYCCRNDGRARLGTHRYKSLMPGDLQPQTKRDSKAGLKAKDGGGNQGHVSKSGAR